MGLRPALPPDRAGVAAVERLYRGTAITTLLGKQVKTIKHVAGPEEHPVIRIATAAGHELTVTRFHPMMTTAGIKPAVDLTRQDRLVTSSWKPVRIKSLKKIAYSGLVYNFELPGEAELEHLVVAEGLITGDLYLQRRLSATRK